MKCGKEIPEKALFCPKCGTQVGVTPKVVKKVSVSMIIEDSLKPAMSIDNFILIFVPTLLLLFVFLNLGPQILFLIAENISDFATGTVDMVNFFFNLLRVFSIAGVTILIYMLFSVYQRGVVIHNIGHKMLGTPKPYSQSMRVGFSRYPSLFVAGMLLGILSLVVGSVRYIGWILTLIVTCIFWVTYQGIIIDELGFAEGFKRSFQYLREYPSSYILAYVIAIIISIIITAIGMIPLGVALIDLIPKILTLIPPTDPAEILRLLAIFFVSPTLYIATIISCIIWTVNALYTEYGIPIKLYLEIRGNAPEKKSGS